MTTNDNQNNTQENSNKNDKPANLNENNKAKYGDEHLYITVAICWLLFYLLPHGCSHEDKTNTQTHEETQVHSQASASKSKQRNSKDQTCEDAINYYLPKHLDLCKQVEYEKSRYRRVPDSLQREFSGSYVAVNLKLLKTFGQECSNKWFNAVRDKNC